VDDAGVGRDDAEAAEGLLGPAQQRVALAVALELEVGVDLERGRRAELVDDHRVVDHQLGGEQRVHPLGVAAHGAHRVAHRGEVHDGGDAGEVLHEDARRHEGDLVVGDFFRIPARQLLDVVRADDRPVFAAQQVLEQDLEREGEAGHGQAAPLQGVEAVDLVSAAAGAQRGAPAEGIGGHSTTRMPVTKYWVSPKQLVGTPRCWW